MATITERYLDRIGLTRDEAVDLDELLAAHAEHIAFEDLDGVAGFPVRIGVEDIAAKLVDTRRGGYCHEHARLSQHVLGELGVETMAVLARVYRDPTLRSPMAKTHHFTLVRVDGQWRIFDPGFGGGTPTRTVPLTGEVVTAPESRLRVVPAVPELGEEMAADSTLLLQWDYGEGWRPAYGFHVTPALDADVEMANWFTASHPDIMFTTTPIAARHLRDGTRLTLRGTILRRIGRGGVEDRTLTDRGEFAATLREEFFIDASEEVLDAAWCAATGE